MKIYNFLFVCLVLLVLFACEKSELRQENEMEGKEAILSEDLLLLFSDMEFPLEGIIETDDYYLVDGDIRILKADLNKLHQNRESKLKHAYCGFQYVIDYSNKDINIFLAEDSFIGVDLADELNQVVNAYNSLNSYLTFNVVNNVNEADVIIREGYLGAGVCASALFPLFGAPGKTIIVSEPVVRNQTHNQLVYLLAHELGHSIGLRHTNWHVAGTFQEPKLAPHDDDESFFVSAEPISGTPSTDSNSVFNRNECGNSWSGFSYYDRKAIETLYPVFSAKISGQTFFDFQCPVTATFTAQGMYGAGSYTYHEWYLAEKKKGYTNWTYIGYGKTVTKTLNYDDAVKLRVRVTCGGKTAYGYVYVHNLCEDGGHPI